MRWELYKEKYFLTNATCQFAFILSPSFIVCSSNYKCVEFPLFSPFSITSNTLHYTKQRGSFNKLESTLTIGIGYSMPNVKSPFEN